MRTPQRKIVHATNLVMRTIAATAMRSEYFREAPDLLAHIRQTRRTHGNPETIPGVPVWEVS